MADCHGYYRSEGPATRPIPRSPDTELAMAAEKREREMSFKESLNADKRLILFSLGFSGTIIMEGYGLALITYLFSFPAFRKRYGVYLGELGTWELDYLWKVFLPLAAQLGSLLGILLASPLASRFGYRRSTQFMLLASAGLISVPFSAKSIVLLMVGFLLLGIPWGVFQVVSPAYASEVASLQLRPILTTWNNLCWVLGQLLASCVAKAFERQDGDLSYRIPLAIQWAFSAVLLVAVSSAPESPYWYLHRGRVSRARQATERLARSSAPYSVEERLALMRNTILQEESQAKATALLEERGRACSWPGKARSGCFTGANLRRTEIASAAWLIQATCGASLIPWAAKLFETAGLLTSDALSVNIALPVAGVFGTVASWWLMRRAGRRDIYLWGLVAMVTILAGCGAFYYMERGAGWAAGASLVVYTAVYDLTVGPVCYSMVSEIPSVRLRMPTIAMARGLYLLANAANHVLTPKMLGSDPSSWRWGARAALLYAGLALLGAVYTYWRIPETKDMSARELDILFQHNISARMFTSEVIGNLEATEANKSSNDSAPPTPLA